jgi:hypothetical protein
MSANKPRDPEPNPSKETARPQQGKSKRPAILTLILVVTTVTLLVFSIVLVVQYTIPTVRTERTSVEWFGWNGTTQGSNPAEAQYTGFFDSSVFCDPSNAIGNLTLSVIWQSSVVNTTAAFFWTSGSVPDVIGHYVYWVNNTTQGGYSFPPSLADSLCSSGNNIICHWYTPSPGAKIALSGIREYNYTALQPAW